MTVYCPSDGVALPDDAVFWVKCGRPLRSDVIRDNDTIYEPFEIVCRKQASRWKGERFLAGDRPRWSVHRC